MRPIIIEITTPITIEQLKECVKKAYEAGYEDCKKEYSCVTLQQLDKNSPFYVDKNSPFYVDINNEVTPV